MTLLTLFNSERRYGTYTQRKPAGGSLLAGGSSSSKQTGGHRLAEFRTEADRKQVNGGTSPDVGNVKEIGAGLFAAGVERAAATAVLQKAVHGRNLGCVHDHQ